MDKEINWDGGSGMDIDLPDQVNEYDNIGEFIGECTLQELHIWEQRRRVATVNLLFQIIRTMCLMKMYYVSTTIVNDTGARDRIRRELMQELTNDRHCRNVIRMGPVAFFRLCHMLRGSNRLKDTRNSSVEEQVAKSLYILGHNERTRPVSLWFRRSTATISRQFHNVLRAIISLEEKFLKQPNGSEVPPEILRNNRFYPYFKDCVGAIDGTHIRVKISSKDAPRYRGRKEYPTQNVLVACGFDMKFTYVLAGWEGTTL